MDVRGSLLVAGTASDAGKSVMTAGICRWLARQGIKVAPFKAQNMSNNSAVTPDGAEIGRAQAMQAAAAGVPATAAMNPVLLKPGSDLRSHLVVLGRPAGEATAASYWRENRDKLRETVLAAYDDLRSRFDVVICEGAGSPAEINLRARDIVNMGLATARGIPVIVIGDIDKGGVFASLFGTLALLDAADQALISGFVINKFRGDATLLDPAIARLRALTGRPVLGVVPLIPGLRLDAEDAVVIERSNSFLPNGSSRLPSASLLTIAVIRLPRISNFTDVDALALEPGVSVRYAEDPAEVAGADLVIVPGTRTTVADLAWLRGQGLDEALKRRAADGRPVLGICGGYQMLGETITDGVESAGTEPVPGLGLLPVRTLFAAEKTLSRPSGYAGDLPVSGYEIHHGAVTVHDGAPMFTSAPGGGEALDGCVSGAVRGTICGTLWHGVFESDAFRREYLSTVARQAGRDFVPAPDTSFAAAREAQFDILADAVEEYLDTDALLRLIESGPPSALSTLRVAPSPDAR
jgi:adenosylcobyric acid synthase